MDMKKFFEKLIDTPIKDPYKAQQARFFHAIIICFGFLLVTIYTITLAHFMIEHPESTWKMAFNIALIISLTLISFGLSKKGHYYTGIYLFLTMLVIGTTMSIMDRGLSYTIVLIYALSVVIGGLLVGPKTAVIFAVFSIMNYRFAFHWLYSNDRIMHSDTFDLGFFNFSALIASLIVLAVLTWLISDGLKKQLVEIRRNRKKYREHEARFKSLFETSTDALMILSENRFIDCNLETLSLFGLSSKREFVNLHPGELSPPTQPDGVKSMIAANKKIAYAFKNGHNKFEWVHRKKCGNDFPAEVWLTSIMLEGKPMIQATVRDISEQKIRERIMEDNVKEKDVLLKEVHHRVKNNLQTISSLLNLQSKHITDEDVLHTFRESQNRIKSMALIHEKLYMAKDLVNIDFKEYVEGLANHLVQSYLINVNRINIKIDVEGVNLGVDKAITCGLIINELVTNSFKHAFPDGREGNVNISLIRENDKINLIVSDDGVGLKEGLDFRNTETLGLQLVNTLVADLKASIELQEGKGTSFLITCTPSD